MQDLEGWHDSGSTRMNKVAFDEPEAVGPETIESLQYTQARAPALKVASVCRPEGSMGSGLSFPCIEPVVDGTEVLESMSRARFVSYMSGGLIHVGLINRCAFVFPIDLIEALSGARAVDLRQIWIESDGLVLHWPRLRARVSLPLLMRGVFGSPDWMRQRLPNHLAPDAQGVPALRKSRVPMSSMSG